MMQRETKIWEKGSQILSGLEPSHLEDLRKSGLSDETIRRAGIKSVPLPKVKERLGFEPSDLTSIYEIPYTDTGYSRFRAFYAEGAVGNKPKYLQSKNTAARPYIFAEVKNLANKNNRPLWITEGEKKALKLIQHGEPTIAISGVWNFKAGKDTSHEDEKDLWNELKEFEWKGRTVYLAFDSDLWVNPHVRYALWELALRLHSLGAIVKFPQWIASEGKGIDDYLVNVAQRAKMAQTAQGSSKGNEPKNNKQNQDVKASSSSAHEILKEIEKLEQNAKTVTDFATAEHEDAILRALSIVELPPVQYEQLTRAIAKKVGVDKKTIQKAINERREQRGSNETYTEEEKEVAQELLKSRKLMDEYLKTCHSQYLGRNKELIIVKLATLSRKFNRGIPVIITGTASVGKSELIKTVLQTMWPEDKEDFTRVSENYFLYRKASLEHKVITFFEMHGAEKSAQLLRTMLTEGELNLGTVVDDPKKGGLTALDVKKEAHGVVLLSTFASGSIDHELNTRVILIELTHDETLARQVLLHKANPKIDEGIIPFRIWQVADHLIEPREVIFAYSDRLAQLFPTKEERAMRDFDKVLALVKSSALLHQFQRNSDEQGRVIATLDDYELVFSLKDLIAQSVSPVPEHIIGFLKKSKELADAAKKPPTREEMRRALGNKSEPTIKRYVKFCSDKDLIVIEGRGKCQTIEAVDIPEVVSPLPSREKLLEEIREPLSQMVQTLDNTGVSLAHDPMSVREPMSENVNPEAGPSLVDEDASGEHIINGKCESCVRVRGCMLSPGQRKDCEGPFHE